MLTPTSSVKNLVSDKTSTFQDVLQFFIIIQASEIDDDFVFVSFSNSKCNFSAVNLYYFQFSEKLPKIYVRKIKICTLNNSILFLHSKLKR